MALDPSIILQGQNKFINPLEVASQAVSLKNQLIQNQGNQQQLDARTALGPIYQAAIDPATGRLDSNKLMTGAANDPRTAYMAADIAKGAQDREAQQVTIDTGKYDLTKKHIQTLQGAFAPLIANPNATPMDYQKAGAQLVVNGLATPEEYLNVMKSMPADPSQLHAWGLQNWTALQDADRQIDILYGKSQQTDTGGQIQQGTQSAVTGYHPQGAFSKTLSPTEAAGTVATVGPNGEPGVISKAGYAASQGIGQGGGAYVPVNGEPMSGGGAPAPQGQPAQGGQPGFMATGLAPGQQASMEDNAKQGQTVLQAANDSRLNVLPLIKEAKLQLAQGVMTGPNSQAMKTAGAFAAQFGIDIGNSREGTAANEVLDKVLEQVAGRQSQILASGGQNSDAKLSSAKNSTPNTHMSALGLQGALATVEGNQNAITLRGAAYQSYLDHGGQPGNFNKFAAAFNKDIDPFVLQIQALPEDQQAKVLKTMSPAERKSYTTASEKLNKLAQAIGWQP